MTIRFIIEFVLLGAIWGASFLFMRIAAPEFGPLALVEIRVLVAGLILLPILIKRKGLKLWGSYSKPLFIISLTNTTIPYSLFAWATLYLSAGYTSVINATAPLWTALLGYLWFGTRVSRSVIIGLFTGFIGVFVLTWDKLTQDSGFVIAGILASLGATLMYGLSVNKIKADLSGIDPLTITTESLLMSAICLLPLAIIYWPEQSISMNAWLSALAMGGVCTALALLLFYKLIHDIGPTKSIAVTYLIPCFGMLFGWLLLDEVITLSMTTGMLLIIAGTTLTMGLIKLSRSKTATV